jgi:chromosome segregation ATPase
LLQHQLAVAQQARDAAQADMVALEVRAQVLRETTEAAENELGQMRALLLRSDSALVAERASLGACSRKLEAVEAEFATLRRFWLSRACVFGCLTLSGRSQFGDAASAQDSELVAVRAELQAMRATAETERAVAASAADQASTLLDMRALLEDEVRRLRLRCEASDAALQHAHAATRAAQGECDELRAQQHRTEADSQLENSALQAEVDALRAAAADVERMHVAERRVFEDRLARAAATHDRESATLRRQLGQVEADLKAALEQLDAAQAEAEAAEAVRKQEQQRQEDNFCRGVAALERECIELRQRLARVALDTQQADDERQRASAAAEEQLRGVIATQRQESDSLVAELGRVRAKAADDAMQFRTEVSEVQTAVQTLQDAMAQRVAAQEQQGELWRQQMEQTLGELEASRVDNAAAEAAMDQFRAQLAEATDARHADVRI